MLKLKIWTYTYSVTIALTACESTKWDFIKNVTAGGQGIHCEILRLHFAMYQKIILKLQ